MTIISEQLSADTTKYIVEPIVRTSNEEQATSASGRQTARVDTIFSMLKNILGVLLEIYLILSITLLLLMIAAKILLLKK